MEYCPPFAMVDLESTEESKGIMAISVDNLTSESLVKPTGTIHLALANKDEKRPLSLVDRKVMNVLIWHFQKNHTAKIKHDLSVDFLCNLTVGKSKNVAHVKKSLTRLAGTVFEWNSFGQDRRETWEFSTFLTSGKIASGIVHYNINPILVEKLANPRLFAKIQLLIQAQFSRKYSLPLYEYLLDVLCRQQQGKTYIELPIEKVYEILEYRGQYKFFKKDILTPCVSEICEKSDIDLFYNEIKEKRRIAILGLTVERKSSFQLPLPIADGIVPSVDRDLEAHQQNLAVLLQDYGIFERKARELVLEYGADYINDKIQLVEGERNLGKQIANVGGYLYTAIKDNYQSGLVIERQLETRKVEKKLEQETLKKAWKNFRKERFQDKFASLCEAELQALRASFVTVLLDNSITKHPMLKDPQLLLMMEYERANFESPVVQDNLELWMKHHLLNDPEEKSLDHYRDYINKRTVLVD